ncbi:MAG: DUF1659 domain-containing protein [Firmicutes bacterium]|nr:DUF1659 domain-containing protein [Bacillota bacterium]
MAIEANSKDSKFRVGFNAGVDEDGKEIIKRKTFSKVKSQATNEDIYAITTSLAGLQERPLVSVSRIDEVELREV